MATLARNRLKVGDEVNVRLGETVWRARIVEDRGAIGVKGRRLLRVRLLVEPEDVPQFVEVPESDIEPPPR
jgi:hypothetical protein